MWPGLSFLRSSRVKPGLLDWLAGLGTNRRRLITSIHDLWIFYTPQDSRFSTAFKHERLFFIEQHMGSIMFCPPDATKVVHRHHTVWGPGFGVACCHGMFIIYTHELWHIKAKSSNAWWGWDGGVCLEIKWACRPNLLTTPVDVPSMYDLGPGAARFLRSHEDKTNAMAGGNC